MSKRTLILIGICLLTGLIAYFSFKYDRKEKEEIEDPSLGEDLIDNSGEDSANDNQEEKQPLNTDDNDTEEK
jgi:hypothetical protein